MGKITQKILDWVYPKNLVCTLCGKEALCDEYGLCEQCLNALKPATTTPESFCIKGFFLGVEYNEHMVKAIHMLKFGDARYICNTLAAFLKLPDDIKFDAIVPVPLYKKRRRKRGYNQSALIAHRLGEIYNISVKEEWLVRIKETASQRSLTKEDRAKNIKDAFLATNDVKGKTILLLDDVITTGATVNECALALLKAGAACVYAAAPCATVLQS